MADKNLKGYNAVALPYDFDDLRLGVDSQQSFLDSKKLSRILLDGKARVAQIQSQYTKSYTNSQRFTLRAYRDQLMSLALSLSTRCMQCRDSNYVNLTQFATRFWGTYPASNYWKTIMGPNYVHPEPGLYGLLGSPAFIMFQNEDTGEDLLPIQFLEKIQHYAFANLGIDSTVSASQLQDDFFEYLELDSIPFSQYQNALSKANAEGNSSAHPSLIRAIREQLLTENDWTFLKQRFLLGEYTSGLLKVLRFINQEVKTNTEFRTYFGLSKVNDEAFEITLDKITMSFNPAGPAGFYMLMTIKGLCNAVRVLQDVEDGLFDQDFGILLKDRVNEGWLIETTSHLSTCYDAMSALGLFQTIYEARGLSYRFYLTALQAIRWVEDPYISEVGPTRLYKFSEAQ